jgi:DNA processing protein
MKILHTLPNELSDLKNPPKQLFYKGNIKLLAKKKIAIVGSRRPYSYTKNIVYELSKKLSNAGICIVSGAAMGVDAIAHSSAGVNNTIAVMGNALDIIYPKINNNLIKNIETNGLALSQFEPGFRATPWSFVLRNKIVVALADAVIIAQADINSGSMRSAEFALEQNKEIFVLPHRLGESQGTNELLHEKKVNAIYDIDEFVAKISNNINTKPIKDEFWEFCSNFPKYQEAIKIYKDRVFEAELNGEITVKNGIIRVC